MLLITYFTTDRLLLSTFVLSTDPSLLHNRRASRASRARRSRDDCTHHISTYTLRYTQLDENSLKWVHVWGSFSHKVPWQFFKLFDFIGKVLHADISDGIPCLFVFFRPCFGLERQSGYQPLSWSPQLYFWLWRCGFHLVQTVKLLWYIQGDTLVTTLDLLVLPNFLTTTVFHVRRQKQILLTCEIFLSERLPSGVTMINRQWCYNY